MKNQFIGNYWHLLVIIGIITLAAFLRFYRLGQNPPALDWDEVSLAYNAWALSETGRDEFGNSWPASIRSFGDYKPPLYTYLLIPTLKIFGRTEFAIRFPSALAGTLTVLVTYWLVKDMVGRVKAGEMVKMAENGLDGNPPNPLPGLPVANHLALLAAFLLAISPWHLQFSRIAFESNVSLFFFVTGIWQLLMWINRENSKWGVVLSAISFSASLMAYHSSRLVAPLVVLATIGVYRKMLLKKITGSWLTMGLSALIVLITVLSIAYSLVFKQLGQSRFAATSFLTIDNLLTVSQQRIDRFNANILDRVTNHRYLIYGKQVLGGYLDHYNLRFWFLDGDSIDRHRTFSTGLLYWFEMPILFVGLISLMRFIRPIRSLKVLWAWFLLAPAASALTGGTPSAVRSLLFLPTFQIFSAVGLLEILSRLRNFTKPVIVVITFIAVMVEGFHYLHQYYVHAPIEQAAAWQYGYRQMVDRVMLEKGNYKKVIITTAYDQPYIFFLWYGNYAPGRWVNDGEFNQRFDKFEYRKIEWEELLGQENVLVVASPAEIKSRPVKWQINYPDGSPVFLATEL